MHLARRAPGLIVVPTLAVLSPKPDNKLTILNAVEPISGFPKGIIKRAEQLTIAMIKGGIEARPPDPPDFPFKFKSPHLPIRASYEGTFEDAYWDKWETNEYDPGVDSWPDWRKLIEVAQAAGYQRHGMISRAVSILKNGADLGCHGTARLPSTVKNSRSVWEGQNGPKVADTLQDWVCKGIVFGPFTPSRMPFSDYKTNPVSVKPKPKGKIRICNDLSAPHDIEPDQGLPSSVNSGINKSLLSTQMSRTEDVCTRIYRFGCPAEAAKCDWNDAYKHISVTHDDRRLQTFTFGGRHFIEKSLTFGCTSSADRYDAVSDTIFEIALKMTGMTRRDAAKVLDDVVALGEKDSGYVGEFEDNFRYICKEVGVSLADTSDKDKAFGPSSEGVILGIHYDLSRWTWRIPEDKADKILILLHDFKNSTAFPVRSLESLAGKLTHYHMIVPPFGKFERSWILSTLTDAANGAFSVRPSSLARDQASWWIRAINVAKTGVRIPDPRRFPPRAYLLMCPDASGGDGAERDGMGSCFMTSNNRNWTYMAWPALIRDNSPNSRGVRFAKKMSCLEAFAALAGLCSEPDLVRNKNVTIRSDNEGFVISYGKGHSRCPYLHTVAKALHFVAESLNMVLQVEKIKRRTGTGPIVADELSHGNIREALNILEHPAPEMSPVIETLRDWIRDPTPSRNLGERITDELAQYTEVLELREF